MICGATAMRFAGRWSVPLTTVVGRVLAGKGRSVEVADLSFSSRVVVSGLYV